MCVFEGEEERVQLKFWGAGADRPCTKNRLKSNTQLLVISVFRAILTLQIRNQKEGEGVSQE